MSDNRFCKSYSQKAHIPPDIFLSGIPINCGNCETFNGERCSNETIVAASQDPELIEPLKLCDW